MGKNINFLDVLRESIEKAISEGNIKREDVRKGIQMPIEWLYADKLDRQYVEGAMFAIMKKINPGYYTKSKFLGKRPRSMKEIRFFMTADQAKVAVEGNDNWTKFLITNKRATNEAAVTQITPEEFEKEVIEARKRKIYQLMLSSRRTGTNLTEKEIEKMLNNAEGIDNEAGFASVVREQLCEMSENLVNYYSFILQRQKNDGVDIDAGAVTIEKGNGSSKTGENKKNINKGKVNELLEFQALDKKLREMNPRRVINFYRTGEKQEKEGKIVTHSVYVFNMNPEKDGELMICEPVSEEETTRLIYLTKERKESLMKAPPIEEQVTFDSDEHWVKISKNYLSSSLDNFREEKNIATMYHTAPEDYIEVVKELITSKGDRDKIKPTNENNKRRLGRIIRRLFEGERHVDIKSATRGVTAREVDEAEEIIAGERQEEKTERNPQEQDY